MVRYVRFPYFIFGLELFFFSTIVSLPAQAQIKSDKHLSKYSLSKALRLKPKIKVVEFSDGTEAGKNLFYSFKYFSIRDNETFRFINDKFNIKNVIVRVTGNKPSTIFGKIESAGLAPNFDFFLINPYGIYFGPNASLGLKGSFIATTADAIQFGDKGSFSTINPEDPSLLTIDPSALSFSQPRISLISYQANNQSKGLSVAKGKSLLLVGGDVVLNEGKLTAPDGQVELGGLKGEGKISLSTIGDFISLTFPKNVNRSNVRLSNNSLIDISGPGNDEVARGIAIYADTIKILNNSRLTSVLKPDSSSGKGEGKVVNVGRILLDATHDVTFSDGGTIFSSVEPKATGNSSNIIVKSELSSIYFLNGGRIVSISIGNGNAGDITIEADDKVFFGGQGNSPDFIPSQLSSSLLPNAIGRSGNITVRAKSLALSDGANIFTGSGGFGNAGNINITVDEKVSLSNISSLESPTQIRSATEADGTGNGGDITITTPIFSMTGGSVISSVVSGSVDGMQGAIRNGGEITINSSKSVLISGAGNFEFIPGIFSSVEKGVTGKSGNIFITQTNSFILSDHAEINVSNPQGQTGDLKINANVINLNNGVISAETGGNSLGNSAIIKLTASDILRIENESLISATANDKANGGNINIDTPILLALPPTGPKGSDIVASAKFGTGGNITITAQGIFGIKQQKSINKNRSNDIDASSEFGSQGQVSLEATLDPGRGLIELPQTVVDPDALLANNPCNRSSDSEFTNIGRGGLPPNLSEDFNSNAAQVSLVEPALDHFDHQPPKTSTNITTSPASASASPAPAQGWVFNDKGEVVLVAYNSFVEDPQRLQTTPAGCPVR